MFENLHNTNWRRKEKGIVEAYENYLTNDFKD